MWARYGSTIRSKDRMAQFNTGSGKCCACIGASFYPLLEPQVPEQTLLPGTSVVCADHAAPKTERKEKAVVEEQVADAADVQDGSDPPAAQAGE